MTNGNVWFHFRGSLMAGLKLNLFLPDGDKDKDNQFYWIEKNVYRKICN